MPGPDRTTPRYTLWRAAPAGLPRRAACAARTVGQANFYWNSYDKDGRTFCAKPLTPIRFSGEEPSVEFRVKRKPGVGGNECGIIGQRSGNDKSVLWVAVMFD